VKTVEEVIASLRESPSSNEQAPSLAELTPEPGSGAHSIGVALARRAAITSPQTVMKTPVMSEADLRLQTQFAIIARHLAFNATNAEILVALADAGHTISERTLNRLMKREDFKRYYTAFQGDVNERIVEMVRDSYVLAAPEAYNHLIRLMRHAKSSDTQLKACLDILRNSGVTFNEGVKSLHVHLPPGIAAALEAEGRRIAGSLAKRLQTGPIIDTELVSSGERTTEDEPPEAE